MWDNIKAGLVTLIGIIIFYINLNIIPIIENIIQITIGILTIIYLTLKIIHYAKRSKKERKT